MDVGIKDNSNSYDKWKFDPLFLKMMEAIPSNYSFEIEECLKEIILSRYFRIALQFPEGLLCYSRLISDIFKTFSKCEVIILGDYVYGACCVDDITAQQLSIDLIIHYGHTQLFPSCFSKVPVRYVNVSINIDDSINHIVNTLKSNFNSNEKIVLVSTVQFLSSLPLIQKELSHYFKKIFIPKNNPLSPGEILGCTAPLIPSDYSLLINIADGRFHLEALMIRNPHLSFYQYNPYNHIMTREKYEVACPRLALDWGDICNRPLLTPFELEVVFQPSLWTSYYPLDNYSIDGGIWSNFYQNQHSI